MDGLPNVLWKIAYTVSFGFESSSIASLSGVSSLQRIVGMQCVAGMMFSTWSVF